MIGNDKLDLLGFELIGTWLLSILLICSYLFQTTQSAEYAQPEGMNVVTEEEQGFVPLVDVGTATMRLSHAHTQTEVNVPPDYVCPPFPTPVAQQTDFCYYNNQRHQVQMTRDSFTVTSPPQISVGNSPQSSTCEFIFKNTIYYNF